MALWECHASQAISSFMTEISFHTASLLLRGTSLRRASYRGDMRRARKVMIFIPCQISSMSCRRSMSRYCAFLYLLISRLSLADRTGGKGPYLGMLLCRGPPTVTAIISVAPM